MSAVLVPFFTQWAGISLFQVQLLQSWFVFLVVLLEIPTGAVADYFGRKHSMVLGAVFTALAALYYSQVKDFHLFLFAEFLFAMGMALMSGADEAWVYDHLKERGREKAEAVRVLGKARSWFLSGLMVSAPIGSWLAANYGLTAPMFWSTIPLILAALVGLTLPEPKNFEKQSEMKRYFQVIKDGVSYLVSHKSLLKLALEGIVLATTGYFVIWLYQPSLQSVGVPIELFGWFNVILLIGQIIVTNNFQGLGRWFKYQQYLLLNVSLSFIGFVLVSLWPSVLTISLLLLTAGGFGLTYFVYLTAQMHKLIPSNKRATVSSAISMLRYLAVAIMNPFVGWGADHSLAITLGGLAIFSWLALIPNRDNNQ